MNLLVGNKLTLGIEFSYINKEKQYGNALLWLGGQAIGSMYDPVFFDGYLLGGLYEIYNKKILGGEFFLNGVIDFKSFFDGSLVIKNIGSFDKAFNYRVNIGTWTDYFSVFSYPINNDMGVLLWKLDIIYDDLFDLAGYPQEIFQYTFKYSDLKLLIDDFSLLIKA